MLTSIIAFSLLTFGATHLPVSLPDIDLEDFDPTVKIISIDELLNGQLMQEVLGSGTLINEDGLIVTNAHVVVSESTNRPFDVFAVCVNVSVMEPPECRFTASLVRYDQTIDLALLQINDKTIFGELPDQFPHLTYDFATEPELKEKVNLLGYPVSGGITLHSTQGQISGFETENGHAYIKTDSDIDDGNSGGTMLDSEGNFIGIPTYFKSGYEVSGRALRISEVKAWIDSGEGRGATANPRATETLIMDWKRLFKAKETGLYTYPNYPRLSLKAPDNWEFFAIADRYFYLGSFHESLSYIQGEISYKPFKEEETFEDKLDDIHYFYGEDYTNHEMVSIGSDKEAAHAWKEDVEGSWHVIHATYGYSYLFLDYFIANQNQEESQASVDAFLTALEFKDPIQTTPDKLTELNDAALPFSLSFPEHWHLAEGGFSNYNVAHARIATDRLDLFKLSYQELPKGGLHLTGEEGIVYDQDNRLIEGEVIVFEDPALKVDGLPGRMIVTEYLDGEQLTITFFAVVQTPMYEINLYHEVDQAFMEEGLDDFLYVLGSYSTKAPSMALDLSEDSENLSSWPEGTVIEPDLYELPNRSDILKSLSN